MTSEWVTQIFKQNWIRVVVSKIFYRSVASHLQTDVGDIKALRECSNLLSPLMILEPSVLEFLFSGERLMIDFLNESLHKNR